MMTYKMTFPKVEVPEEQNFTRQLKVFRSGNPILDLQIDENEYNVEYEFLPQKELRVDVIHEGETEPIVLRHTTSLDDTSKVVIDHSHVKVECHNMIDKIKSPECIPNNLCTHCLNGLVEHSGDSNYGEKYWQCTNCDSIFPFWFYPLGLSQKCNIWNNVICEYCDYIGIDVKNHKCPSCYK